MSNIQELDTKYVLPTYARADVEMKRKALENAYENPTPKNIPQWQQDDSLLEWLKSLGN